MATLVASAGGGDASPSSSSPPAPVTSSSSSSPLPSAAAAPSSPSSSSTHNETRPGVSPRPSTIQPQRLTNEKEITAFLLEHFVPTEPILASLSIENKNDLCVLLSDIVHDCIQCTSTCGTRDREGALTGVCLASKAALFEKQMDRLWHYEFSDEPTRIACEFLKYVFNRVDVVYHCEELKIQKPVFVAVVSVRSDCHKNGIGNALLEHCLLTAAADKNDGALVLCSSSRAMHLMQRKFKDYSCRIRYCDYRGEYRNPPIAPPSEDDHSLHVMLTRLHLA